MKKVLILNALLLAVLPALAENTSTESSEPAAPVAPAIVVQTTAPAQPASTNAAVAPAPAPKFVLLIPEQVDSEWFWYYYSDTAQHIVQTAIEKALVNAGFDVIDIASIKDLQTRGTLEEISSNDGATKIAKESGATFAVVGRATAMKASESTAYGVNVVRSQAEITLRIIRVADGKVMDVEDASAQTGGQSQRVAGQEALKTAGKDVARKVVAGARKVTAQ